MDQPNPKGITQCHHVPRGRNNLNPWKAVVIIATHGVDHHFNKKNVKEHFFDKDTEVGTCVDVLVSASRNFFLIT